MMKIIVLLPEFATASDLGPQLFIPSNVSE